MKTTSRAQVVNRKELHRTSISEINSGLRNLGIRYNQGIQYLPLQNIILNRKVLREIVVYEPKILVKLFLNDTHTIN